MRSLLAILFLLVAHAADAQMGMGQYRAFLYAEKLAWKSLFRSEIAHRFLDHYIEGSQTPLTLSAQDVANLYPEVYFEKDARFLAMLETSSRQARSSLQVFTIPAYSAGGTLGSFFVTIRGRFFELGNGNRRFLGLMTAYDRWDFDHGSHRSPSREMRTRFAGLFLAGKPFDIYTAAVPIQVDYQPRRRAYTARMLISPNRPAPDYSRFGKEVNSMFEWVYERGRHYKKQTFARH